MLMRALKTRHHACPRPRTAYKMAAELLREEDKREKPDQPVPPTTTQEKWLRHQGTGQNAIC